MHFLEQLQRNNGFPATDSDGWMTVSRRKHQFETIHSFGCDFVVQARRVKAFSSFFILSSSFQILLHFAVCYMLFSDSGN